MTTAKLTKTRLEIIGDAANEGVKHTLCSGTKRDYYMAFLEGAQWADSHPTKIQMDYAMEGAEIHFAEKITQLQSENTHLKEQLKIAKDALERMSKHQQCKNGSKLKL